MNSSCRSALLLLSTAVLLASLGCTAVPAPLAGQGTISHRALGGGRPFWLASAPAGRPSSTDGGQQPATPPAPGRARTLFGLSSCFS